MNMRSVHAEIEPLLDEIIAFLPRVLEACNSISEYFYVPVQAEAWTRFSELLQGLNDLYIAANSIGQELADREEDALLHKVITNFAEQLAHTFTELNRLMDEEEFIQAADCIKYELAELIHALAIKLGEDKEGTERRFAANLAYLERHHPQVHHVLKSARPDYTRYQLTYASNGSPNLYLRTSEDKWMYLYSNYEPEHEAGRWLDTMGDTLTGKTNIVVYGFGFGYHLLQMARTFPKQQLIIYEPDEQVLLAAMQAIELQPLLEALNVELFIAGWDKTTRHKTFFHFVKYAKGDTALVSLPAYDRVDPQRKQQFFEDALAAVQHFEMSAVTSAFYGIQLYQNRLYNLSYLLNTPSIRNMKDRLKGHTAVVVGSGPSLEKDIENLRKIRDHAFIIAAGTAAQSLLHFGIKPHLVVSLDFGESNDTAFKHLDLDDVPFLYSPQLKYTIMEGKRKPMLLMLENDYTSIHMLGLDKEEPLFTSSTPSVTGPAIEAAIYMGCEQIVLTGQDLSYPTESVYAVGTIHVTEDESKSAIASSKLLVENVQGGMNRTNNAMQVTLNEIGKLLGKYPMIRFINSSQLGAKIENTEYQPLDEVMKQLADVHVASELLAEAMAAHLRPFDEAHKAAITKRLLDMPQQVETIEATLKRMKQKLGGLQALSRTKPAKCHKTMVDIEEMWETVVHNKLFEYSIAFIITNDIITYERNLSELVEEKNVVRKADLFCQVVGKLAEAILECLPMVAAIVNEAIHRVERQRQPVAAE